jgi:hypothetical protein
LVWSAFVPSVTTRLTVSTFTPDVPIVVTRIQAQAINAPRGCTVAAVPSLNDLAAQGVAVAASANDSGPQAWSFPAGQPLRLTVAQVPSCSGKQAAAPSNVNVVVQYKLQVP